MESFILHPIIIGLPPSAVLLSFLLLTSRLLCGLALIYVADMAFPTLPR